jgi:anti-sigma factor RsiW
LTAEIARDRLTAIAADDPDAAAELAAELMTNALRMISDGYPTAAKLAAETLTICSGAPAAGYAPGWLR